MTAARKAVALAIAQNRQEAEQRHRLNRSIADLEDRAVEAIKQGKSDLARAAAETIAKLQAEREASKQAQDQFTSEIARPKNNVRKADIGSLICNAASGLPMLRTRRTDYENKCRQAGCLSFARRKKHGRDCEDASLRLI